MPACACLLEDTLIELILLLTTLLILGFSPDNPMVFNSGEVVGSFEDIPLACNVVKYGAGTEHTIGKLNFRSVVARGRTARNEVCNFYGQIEVTQLNGSGEFATDGDSGSLVLVTTHSERYRHGRIRALGVYVGNLEHGGALVTPIWAVLHKLHVAPPLRLLSFETQLARVPRTNSAEYLRRRMEYENQIQNRLGQLGEQFERLKMHGEAAEKSNEKRFSAIDAKLMKVEQTHQNNRTNQNLIPTVLDPFTFNCATARVKSNANQSSKDSQFKPTDDENEVPEENFMFAFGKPGLHANDVSGTESHPRSNTFEFKSGKANGKTNKSKYRIRPN